MTYRIGKSSTTVVVAVWTRLPVVMLSFAGSMVDVVLLNCNCLFLEFKLAR